MQWLLEIVISSQLRLFIVCSCGGMEAPKHVSVRCWFHFNMIDLFLSPMELLWSVLEHGSSAVECRTRNQVSPGSNRPFATISEIGIFVISTVAPVHSAV